MSGTDAMVEDEQDEDEAPKKRKSANGSSKVCPSPVNSGGNCSSSSSNADRRVRV